jgi:hypothetical protein
VSSELEYKELLARHRAALAEQARLELYRAADLIDRFTGLAASVGISLDYGAFDYIPTVGVVATAPRLATSLLGDMKPDKDGLFLFEQLVAQFPPPEFQEGYFRGASYMFMAHPCFRRAMHPFNNWAPRFVDRYWQLDLSQLDKYIALDEDRVRIDVDGPSYFEADTWYGAPFNEDIREIPPGTVKLRPPSDIEAHHIEFFFAQTYCLDIKWSESRNVKSFQALEVKTPDVWVELDGLRYYPARYLHAEFDMHANCFRHFDGAIQFLSEAEYLLRRDSDFNVNLKGREHVKARSKKMFKLNGPLATATWVELCCHFLPANPLIFEYFGGSYPQHVTDFLANVRSRRNGDA